MPIDTYNKKEKHKSYHWLIWCGILVVLGVVYHFPWINMTGIPHFKSQDTYFHFNRLIGLQNVWISPVNFKCFAGNGPMTNIFYPWLTMFPMRILYEVTDSYVAAYKLYVLLLTIGTSLLAFYVGRKLTNRDINAICFAVLYTFSSYRFADLFRRAAIGESIAIMFLPLVLLGVVEIIWRDYHKWATLSLGMALIAYSHVLTLFMTSLVIGIICIITFLFWDEKANRVMSFLKAALLALVLSAAVLVPMIELVFTNEIFQPQGSGEGLGKTAYRVGDIIVKSVKNIATQHQIGLLTLVVLLMSVVFVTLTSWKTTGNIIGLEKKRELSVIRWITFFGVFFFLGTTSLLPWRFIGSHTPLKVIQFTWRFNSYSTLFAAAAGGWILPGMVKTVKQKTWAIMLLCLAAVILHYGQTQSLLASEHEMLTDEVIASFKETHFDYAPKKAAEYREANGYFMDTFLLNGTEMHIPTEISGDGTSYYIFAAQQTQNTELDIPVFWYATQQCRMNGKEVISKMSERGTTLVELPAENDIVVEISYQYSLMARISWIISGTAALLTCFMCIRDKRKEVIAV